MEASCRLWLIWSRSAEALQLEIDLAALEAVPA